MVAIDRDAPSRRAKICSMVEEASVSDICAGCAGRVHCCLGYRPFAPPRVEDGSSWLGNPYYELLCCWSVGRGGEFDAFRPYSRWPCTALSAAANGRRGL